MASLKDLVKQALDKKQGVAHSDGHDAVARSERTDTKKDKSAPAVKPAKRVTGRGR